MYHPFVEVAPDGPRLVTYRGRDRAAAREREQARRARRSGLPVVPRRVLQFEFELYYAGLPAEAGPPFRRRGDPARYTRVDVEQPYPEPTSPEWRPEADGLRVRVETYGTRWWSGELPLTRISGATLRLLPPGARPRQGPLLAIPLDALPSEELLGAWSDTVELPPALLAVLPPDILRPSL